MWWNVIADDSSMKCIITIFWDEFLWGDIQLDVGSCCEAQMWICVLSQINSAIWCWYDPSQQIHIAFVVIKIPWLISNDWTHWYWRCGPMEEVSYMWLSLYPTCLCRGWFTILLKLEKAFAKVSWVGQMLSKPHGACTCQCTSISLLMKWSLREVHTCC